MKAAGLKNFTRGTNFVVITLLAAGILTVLNALSYRHFFRIDLTENKKFTIADSTKQIISGLDDIINIKVYLSKKLPPYMATITDQVRDLLEEYNVYARGNLVIEYIDPADDPSMQQKLQFMGIPQLRLNIVEKDQAAVTNVYMGLAVLYGDSKEVIPALTDLATLEYELTGKILRVKNKDIKTIGFLTGHGEPGLEKDLETIDKELKEQYYTKPVDTTAGEKIPGDIAALVVASPKKLSERDLFEIDQYIMSGGKALFLVDMIAIEERSLQGMPLNSSLETLTEHYGIRVAPELVLDRLNENASFRSGPYSVFVPYPFWLRVVRESVATDHPIINGLESMVLPWASPLEILPDKTKDKTAAILAQSTEYSFTQKGNFDLNPRQEFEPPQPGEMKQRVLAAAVTGKFSSFFADKPVPPAEKKEKPAGEEEPALATLEAQGKDKKKPGEEKKDAEPRTIIKESPETKIIVVGNSRFIENNFTAQFDGNRAFFLNAIDWFTLGDSLMGIRSRESGESALRVISDKAKVAVRYINMFGMSCLLAVFGLVQFYLRRRRK
ncbi:MAG: Gldg family protein, partial [Pseudomonadota bacterium]